MLELQLVDGPDRICRSDRQIDVAILRQDFRREDQTKTSAAFRTDQKNLCDDARLPLCLDLAFQQQPGVKPVHHLKTIMKCCGCSYSAKSAISAIFRSELSSSFIAVGYLVRSNKACKENPCWASCCCSVRLLNPASSRG